MFKCLSSGLVRLLVCKVAQPLKVALLQVKNQRDFLDRVIFGLWIHEPRENEVKYQNGDINSITSQVVSHSITCDLQGATHYFHSMASRAMGFTN